MPSRIIPLTNRKGQRLHFRYVQCEWFRWKQITWVLRVLHHAQVNWTPKIQLQKFMWAISQLLRGDYGKWPRNTGNKVQSVFNPMRGRASVQWAIAKLLSEILEDWGVHFISENTESALQWSDNSYREKTIGVQAMVGLHKKGPRGTGTNS